MHANQSDGATNEQNTRIRYKIASKSCCWNQRKVKRLMQWQRDGCGRGGRPAHLCTLHASPSSGCQTSNFGYAHGMMKLQLLSLTSLTSAKFAAISQKCTDCAFIILHTYVQLSRAIIRYFLISPAPCFRNRPWFVRT